MSTIITVIQGILILAVSIIYVIGITLISLIADVIRRIKNE